MFEELREYLSNKTSIRAISPEVKKVFFDLFDILDPVEEVEEEEEGEEDDGGQKIS